MLTLSDSVAKSANKRPPAPGSVLFVWLAVVVVEAGLERALSSPLRCCSSLLVQVWVPSSNGLVARENRKVFHSFVLFSVRCGQIKLSRHSPTSCANLQLRIGLTMVHLELLSPNEQNYKF